MPRDTLVDVFGDLSRADGPFLVHDDGFRSRTFTYADVGRAVHGFAGRLHAHGVRKGDAVVLFSENRPEWIVAFWACVLRGIVVVPLDYRSSPDLLARVSRIVSAKVVLAGQDVPAVADASCPVWPLADIGWTDSASGLDPVAITKDDVAEIIFTSGATADPKGVVITHRNILANIVPVEREILKYRKWGTPFFPLRFLNLLPLSHMFGQAMATFIPPALPGVVVFMRGYNPSAIATIIKKRRISVLVCVPKILDVLREHVDRTEAAKERTAPTGRRARGLLGVGQRWWHYREVHRLFGWKFWAFVVGAAPLDAALEAYWGERGFAVIQGYGLTETAPIVTLNHPFGTRRGSVGKAIAGVQIRIADDGEILVKGDNVTTGYYHADEATRSAFEDGWFHTGDIGEIGEGGQLFIRGRKKEMIVTPEGLNVFPEDVERVFKTLPGVHDIAVVGAAAGSDAGERVHAVVIADPGTDVEGLARLANAQLADHQKVRRVLVWPGTALPRTEGTGKLKRAAIREWVRSGGQPTAVHVADDPLAALMAKYTGRTDIQPGTSIDELGLSSLERVELMVALEDAFQTPIDEGAFAAARQVSELRALVEPASTARVTAPEPVSFPAWNRSLPARAIRRASLPTWILPIAKMFAHIRVEGREHLDRIDAPVIFAANHQSHMDVPVLLAALPPRLRYRAAPAMAKEFFKAHFFPGQYGRRAWLTSSANYYLSTLFFNAFPLPQREAGARQTLRYVGDLLSDGFSVILFPEGRRTETGAMFPFRPGVGMMASRLGVPVVPVRIEGLDKVLHHSWKMARPGPVRVAFGPPLKLTGDDYPALAKRVEEAVRAL